MNSELGKPVYFSTGVYGRTSIPQAMQMANSLSIHEPLLGELSLAKVQLCPQNISTVNAKLIDYLQSSYPNTQFRLHANVRITPFGQIVDACDWAVEKDWFTVVASLNRLLGSPVYTLHAGKNKVGLEEVLAGVLEMESVFDSPVGIEGHYPTQNHHWLFDCWQEYDILLHSNVKFVVDLSHLNIVAHQSGDFCLSLVKELLESSNCVEVHISNNDGARDLHLPLIDRPWWWDTLCSSKIAADIFSEGSQLRAAYPR